MISALSTPETRIFYNNLLYNVVMNEILVNQVKEFLETEDTLSALCNISAAIKLETDRINWAGFYLFKNGKLSLGPFQGKPACSSIDIGKGVCGTAYEKKMLLNINDVTRFEGHIVCDPDSCSELVAPLMYDNKIFGVLDIDSQEYRRFGVDEEETFEAIATLVARKFASK